MDYKYLLLLTVVAAFVSCKKEKETITAPPSVQQVLLKDIVIPRLPSPYYHFEYDTAGKVKFASFASGFFMYEVLYNGDRISEMKNNSLENKDKLQYFYDNEGRVNAINYTDSNGIVYERIFFSYDARKLVKLERDVKTQSGFIVDKTMTFSYQADGNLQDLTEHRPPVNGQNEATYIDRFEQYDNKINTDGFSLVHDEFFDHLVLLPGVQFQENNPGKVTHTGDGINYRVDYTYTYNDKNLPLTKTGEGLISNGTNAGERFQANSVYTYY